jgi:hypothetical protein
MSMPTFLIIGAAKAGTTSLYRYLGQHPEVYVSPLKEPSFFAVEPEPRGRRRLGSLGRVLASRPVRSPLELRAVTDPDEYRGLFARGAGARAIGEASTAYLHTPLAAERIRRALPAVRLVAILRDPALRAYSSYRMVRLYGLEPCETFEGAISTALVEGGWRRSVYLERGLYARHLRRYFELFPASRLRLVLSEELRRDPRSVLRDLFGFIGVDDRFRVDLALRHNVGGVPRGPAWRAALRSLALARPLLQPLVPPPPRSVAVSVLERLQAAGTREPPPLAPALRAELIDYYRNDIARLEELLGRSLESWLSP